MKNSTWVILPSGSEAVAVRVTVAGGVKLLPTAGLVRLTDGTWFPGAPVKRILTTVAPSWRTWRTPPAGS